MLPSAGAVPPTKGGVMWVGSAVLVEGPVARGAAKRSCLAALLAASSEVRPALGMLAAFAEPPPDALAFLACCTC